MAPKRWDRSKYPANWDELARSAKEQQNYTCEHCGVVQGTVRISKAGNPYSARVAAAHARPNDTRNPDPDLLVLCERCHYRYDNQVAEVEHQVRMHEIALDKQWCEACQGYYLPHEH